MKMAGTRTKTPEEYLEEPYARVLIPEEEGGFSAEILEFPGCFSQGDTADEALKNLEEAAKNWIEATLEQGRSIPEPSALYGYGGKVALRLPRGTHQKAARMAEREGVSLNTFLVDAIAARVGALDLYNQMAQRFEQRFATKATEHVKEIAIPLINILTLPSYKVVQKCEATNPFASGISFPVSEVNQ